MGISGGGDRSELRPLKRDGNVQHDVSDAVVVGNHKGEFSGFNIVNPKPGTVHQFGTKRDILSARQRGWWIARPEDGRPASELMSEYLSESGTPIDSAGSLYPEYIHLVTSEENFRRLMKEREDRNREQLAPAGMGYLENISPEEFATGRTARGHLPTRFALKEHGTTFMEDGREVAHMAPQGILREEDV